MNLANHLIIDAEMLGRGGDHLLSDEDRMFNFLYELTRKIKMNILAGPDIYRGHEKLPGITGGVVGVLSGRVYVETSHINIHTFTLQGKICFDCFSCQEFDPTDVIKLFETYYPADIIKIQTVDRQQINTTCYRAMRKEGN